MMMMIYSNIVYAVCPGLTRNWDGYMVARLLLPRGQLGHCDSCSRPRPGQSTMAVLRSSMTVLLPRRDPRAFLCDPGSGLRLCTGVCVFVCVFVCVCIRSD